MTFKTYVTIMTIIIISLYSSFINNTTVMLRVFNTTRICDTMHANQMYQISPHNVRSVGLYPG